MEQPNHIPSYAPGTSFAHNRAPQPEQEPPPSTSATTYTAPPPMPTQQRQATSFPTGSAIAAWLVFAISLLIRDPIWANAFTVAIVLAALRLVRQPNRAGRWNGIAILILTGLMFLYGLVLAFGGY